MVVSSIEGICVNHSTYMPLLIYKLINPKKFKPHVILLHTGVKCKQEIQIFKLFKMFNFQFVIILSLPSKYIQIS